MANNRRKSQNRNDSINIVLVIVDLLCITSLVVFCLWIEFGEINPRPRSGSPQACMILHCNRGKTIETLINDNSNYIKLGASILRSCLKLRLPPSILSQNEGANISSDGILKAKLHENDDDALMSDASHPNSEIRALCQPISSNISVSNLGVSVGADGIAPPGLCDSLSAKDHLKCVRNLGKRVRSNILDPESSTVRVWHKSTSVKWLLLLFPTSEKNFADTILESGSGYARGRIPFVADVQDNFESDPSTQRCGLADLGGVGDSRSTPLWGSGVPITISVRRGIYNKVQGLVILAIILRLTSDLSRAFLNAFIETGKFKKAVVASAHWGPIFMDIIAQVFLIMFCIIMLEPALDYEGNPIGAKSHGSRIVAPPLSCDVDGCGWIVDTTSDIVRNHIIPIGASFCGLVGLCIRIYFRVQNVKINLSNMVPQIRRAKIDSVGL